MTGSVNRGNNYNILGFAAASMVILGHMSHMIGIAPMRLMGQPVSTLAVKMLFAVSGCLTAASYMRDPNVLRYALRRISRVMPGLIGVVLLSIFVVGPIFTTLTTGEYFSHEMTWSYLKNTVLYVQYALPGVFAENPYPNAVNGSLWTLPVQMGLYALLPLLFLCFRKADKTKLAFIAAILLEGLYFFITICYPKARLVVWGTDIVGALAIIPYFFAGIVFCSPKVKKYLNLQAATALVLVAAMFDLSPLKTELVVFLIFPYFVFSFALQEKPFFGACFAKNDYSYGMYLYGFVVQQIVVTLLWDYQLTLNKYFVICYAATIVMGVLSWFCIEKPCQLLMKKILKLDKIKNLSQAEMKIVE